MKPSLRSWKNMNSTTVAVAGSYRDDGDGCSPLVCVAGTCGQLLL